MRAFIGRTFAFDGRIDRGTFIVTGAIAFALKFAVDHALAAIFHVDWTLRNYVAPLGTGLSSNPIMADAQFRFLAALLALSIPFACFGVALVVRRLHACALSPWLAVLFFVPFANLALFLALALLPSRDGNSTEAMPPPGLLQKVPSSHLGSALFAVVLTSLIGFGILVLGSQVVQEYGWGLFVAAPFTQGALAAYIFGVREQRSLRESIGVALLSVSIAGACLLLFAFEGAVCIAMAFPLAAAFAAIGAVFGRSLHRGGPQAQAAIPTVLVLIFAAPAVMGVGLATQREASTFAVTTSVIVDAPVARVWHRVLSFPQLAPPAELTFRLGVAYPIRARIVGHGVGAVRYCQFSTGPFVEPITVWDTNRRLAFRVTSNPEPMQEWTPFAHIHPPHLDGYMQSLRGEFILEALPDGRTRLTGTTWYRHHLWPEQYWRLWSDAIIHQIHTRVLTHIATLAEQDTYAYNKMTTSGHVSPVIPPGH